MDILKVQTYMFWFALVMFFLVGLFLGIAIGHEITRKR